MALGLEALGPRFPVPRSVVFQAQFLKGSDQLLRYGRPTFLLSEQTQILMRISEVILTSITHMVAGTPVIVPSAVGVSRQRD